MEALQNKETVVKCQKEKKKCYEQSCKQDKIKN